MSGACKEVNNRLSRISTTAAPSFNLLPRLSCDACTLFLPLGPCSPLLQLNLFLLMVCVYIFACIWVFVGVYQNLQNWSLPKSIICLLWRRVPQTLSVVNFAVWPFSFWHKSPVCPCVQRALTDYVWVPVSGSRKPPTVGQRQSKDHSRNALRQETVGRRRTHLTAKPNPISFLSPQPPVPLSLCCHLLTKHWLTFSQTQKTNKN